MREGHNNKDLMKRPVRVKFSGKLEQIRMNDTRFNYPRGLFLECTIDGRPERHHMWVTLSRNALAKVQRGKFIECTAILYTYLNPETLKNDKIGVKKLRNIKVLRKRRC